jgi:hypothetical protein
MRVLQGPRTRVHSLAFAPDGRTLAYAAGNGRVVHLWDRTAEKPCGRLVGHAARLLTLAYAPDGRTLATADSAGKVHLWDPCTAARRTSFQAESQYTRTLVFGPEGRWLAAGSGLLYGWDLATGRRFQWTACGQFGPFERPVAALAGCPDGRFLAWCHAREPAVHLREPLSGRCWSGWLPRLPAPASALAFAPDGHTLAAVTGWSVALYDVDGPAPPRPRAELHGHEGAVWKIAFAPDGRTLATAGDDRTVRFWDAASGREQGRYDWRIGKVRSVAFAPDGLTAAAGGAGGAIVLWDVGG